MNNHLKYIQVIDITDNCTYIIFGTTQEEYEIIFPEGKEIEFMEPFYELP